MTDHVVGDWMAAPTSGAGLTAEEEEIVADYVQCGLSLLELKEWWLTKT